MRKFFTHFLALTLLFAFGARVTTYAQRNLKHAQNTSTVQKLEQATKTPAKPTLAHPIKRGRVRDESNHLTTTVLAVYVQFFPPTHHSLIEDSPKVKTPSVIPSIPTPPPSVIS